MDNFDLRKYLKEGILVKEIKGFEEFKQTGFKLGDKVKFMGSAHPTHTQPISLTGTIEYFEPADEIGVRVDGYGKFIPFFEIPSSIELVENKKPISDGSEITNLKNNPLYSFVETVPLGGEVFKDFLRIAWKLSIKQLEEILPPMESKRKFYASQRGGVLSSLNKRSKEMLDSFIEMIQNIIETKKEDPNYIPKEYQNLNEQSELTPDLIKEKIIEKIKSANTKQRSVSDDYDVAYFEGVMSGLEEILEEVFNMENVYFLTKR